MLRNTLCEKRNWIIEYKQIRDIMTRITSKLTELPKYAMYVNVKNKVRLCSKNRTYVLECQKSKFFYSLIKEKNGVRSYTEKRWSKLVDKVIDCDQWRRVYMNRVHVFSDNKLREFMYKLFHNLIPCRVMLVRWKKQTSEMCPICKCKETIEHIYFDCECIKNVWNIIGNKLDIDLNWDKIFLGYLQDIPVHRVRNLIFTIVMYAKYKLWAKSLCENVTPYDFNRILMNDLSKWDFAIDNTTFDKDHSVFRVIWKSYNLSNIMMTM